MLIFNDSMQNIPFFEILVSTIRDRSLTPGVSPDMFHKPCVGQNWKIRNISVSDTKTFVEDFPQNDVSYTFSNKILPKFFKKHKVRKIFY